MGGGLPRRWAQSFSNAAVVASFKRKAAVVVSEAAKHVGALAGDAARAAGSALREAALAKAQTAKELVVRGGSSVRRQAAAYIKANADTAVERLRTTRGLAVAQVQTAFSEYSMKFMQTATDFAVRIISKQQQAKEQAKENNAVAPISIETKAAPQKNPEDTPCAKGQ